MQRSWRNSTTAIFACVAVTTAPVGAVGTDELGRFLGTWQGSGALVDTPYSKAGIATATTTCAWSSDGVFMICQQSSTVNGKADHAVAVYTYDPATSKYRFYHMSPIGGDGAVIVVSGDAVTYTNSFSDGGKRVTIRTLNVWKSPSLYRWQTEYSVDSGGTWKLMGSGTSTRSGAP